ncbi:MULTISPECIES: TetR/AcrR family transcriptional regulator [Actinomadura]|uniref:TetR family transcriptional regulator n=1 Tax=Actinomadura litoris TaxID=2678616 RepID=A0A7K1KW76_9ACTN|nr:MULTISPECIES: helix-turn-helix domain-containing protein [Actinomadura]MBT2211475.1 TetR family transcriptional regulator C-terminal domain-containing protein [Actinomadura sp. NEAU-AAG7]MUN36389.1 TetR family transcriptional regulator [Actinomadura litoris]
MARPSRAHERRADLVAAARRAVIGRGVLDLRLRDVAEEADMSSGSVLYYFPTLDDLLREVQREAVERFCAGREEAVRGEPDPLRRLAAMVRSGLPTGPDDELCVLLYELGTIARRDVSYAAEHIRLYERQVGIYAGILDTGAATGAFTLTRDAATIARNLVALEDGYGLHIVMAAPTLDAPRAARLLLAAAADATGLTLEAIEAAAPPHALDDPRTAAAPHDHDPEGDR